MKSLGDAAVLQSILERVQRVRPESRPLWGRMSANQMVCHLADSFRSGLGEKHISPASGVLQRTVMKWFALWAPVPWPKNVQTRPEAEQGAGGTPPTEFDKDRADLVATIRRFSAPDRSLELRDHPFFGPLNDRERQRWGYLHADHHLRQFGV
jgi:hypothetical protein